MTSQSYLLGSPVRTCPTTGLTVCEVTELTNVVTYTFTVVVRNAVGAGTASAASNAVTPRGALTRTIPTPGDH